MRSDKAEAHEVIFGRNPVLEAMRSDRLSVDKVLLQQGSTGSVVADIRRLAGESGIPIQYVPRTRLDRLSRRAKHQGVVATTTAVPYADFRSLVVTLNVRVGDSPTRLLYLDRVKDPRNFGAILRTAAAMGVRAVLVPATEAAPLNAVAVKASAGTALHMDVARVENAVDALEELRERGFWVLYAASGEGTPACDVNWARPIVLVVGSEEVGVHASIRRVCDEAIHIPISGQVESLNVSTATAILLYEAARSNRERHGTPE